MKKGQVILLTICTLSICVVLGIFLGRNLPGHYILLPPNTVKAEQNVQNGMSDFSTETIQVTEAHMDLVEGPVDLNAATKSQLMELPGIGEVLAQRILDYRQMIGSFEATDDLLEVKGIGEKKLEQIKPFVRIGG